MVTYMTNETVALRLAINVSLGPGATQGERQMFHFMPCFQNLTHRHTDTHTHTVFPAAYLTTLHSILNDKCISIHFPNALQESPSSSGSRNLVSIKVQPVIRAFKECSKWQESLGGQFVFSWGAVFVAFSLPRGKQGQSAAACRGLWELLTSDPCCGSHGRFPEEGHHCQRLQPYITTACDAIYVWIVPVHHRYKSEIWHVYHHKSCLLIVTHMKKGKMLFKKTKRQSFGDGQNVVDTQLTIQHY